MEGRVRTKVWKVREITVRANCKYLALAEVLEMMLGR